MNTQHLRALAFAGSHLGLFTRFFSSSTSRHSFTRQRCIFLVAVVFCIRQVSAQTFTILYNFSALNAPAAYGGINNDGAYPTGQLLLSGGTLYGTAGAGGDSDCGTVFKLNIDGTGFSTLYSFSGFDGKTPMGSLMLAQSTLYGTTDRGGGSWGQPNYVSGVGGVFAVNIDGSGFTNLYSFTVSSSYPCPCVNPDGMQPRGGLCFLSNTLYGTTYQGGASGNGAVFSVSTAGTGFAALYSFSSYPPPDFWPTTNVDGAWPYDGLILLSNTLYGTTPLGGTSGQGTVFAMKTDGTRFTNLHNFSATVISTPSDFGTNIDGASPPVSLVLAGHTLYGMTTTGGTAGRGTIYAINTDGTGFRTLHYFTGGADGARPQTGKLVLAGNTLYGTTLDAGDNNTGTIFKINTDGSGFAVIYTFPEDPNISDRYRSLLAGDHILYGVSTRAGTWTNGFIFSLSLPGWQPQLAITPSGDDVILSVLRRQQQNGAIKLVLMGV